MEARGCVKGGCIGCVALAALAVGVPLLLAVAARISGPSEPDPRSRELSRELPALPGGGAPGEIPGAAPGAPAPADEGAARVPLEAESAEVPALSGAGEPVRIVLDLSKGSFVVEPGPPGGALRVEADYDASRFELEESLDPGGREYRLRFDSKGGLLSLFRPRLGEQSRVRLVIPRGYPVVLVGEISMGESRLELGGLWLTEADLRLSMGDHHLGFREPLATPAESLAIEGTMGELDLEDLGNASPRLLRVDHRFGSARVDLGGAWRNDAEVEVECGLGECVVQTPDEAAVVLERAEIRLGERTGRGLDRVREARPGEPTVRLSARSSAGELRIE